MTWSMLGLGAVVFVASVALDFAAARYNRAMREERPHAAARWSIAMCLLSATALLALVEVSRWMLVPECAGLYLGTWLGTTLGSRALIPVGADDPTRGGVLCDPYLGADVRELAPLEDGAPAGECRLPEG